MINLMLTESTSIWDSIVAFFTVTIPAFFTETLPAFFTDVENNLMWFIVIGAGLLLLIIIIVACAKSGKKRKANKPADIDTQIAKAAEEITALASDEEAYYNKATENIANYNSKATTTAELSAEQPQPAEQLLPAELDENIAELMQDIDKLCGDSLVEPEPAQPDKAEPEESSEKAKSTQAKPVAQKSTQAKPAVKKTATKKTTVAKTRSSASETVMPAQIKPNEYFVIEDGTRGDYAVRRMGNVRAVRRFKSVVDAQDYARSLNAKHLKD